MRGVFSMTLCGARDEMHSDGVPQVMGGSCRETDIHRRLSVGLDT